MNQPRIGSRGSDLALWQSRTVLAALQKQAPAADWH
jgi:porphobilinogen deaminase